MQTDGSLIGVPCLEDAIDRYPLIVLPDATLADVLTLMSQTLSNRCVVSDVDTTSPSDSLPNIRSSCVLVMQGTELLGIFTERDIVKLTAAGTDFAAVKIVEVMAHPVITLSKASFQDVFAPLFLFRRYRIRHLVVVDESQQVLGIVTPASIRQILRPSNLLKMRRVSEVMSSQVIHAPPTTVVINLAQMMATHRVSCIVIVEVDSSEEGLPTLIPVGIITERDIMQYKALGVNLWETQAQVVMSTPLFLLDPEDSLWFAHQEMQTRHVQRLVVSWNWGTKLGIVTQTSVLRIFDPLEMYRVMETLQQTITQLENEKTQYLNKQNITEKASIKENIIPSENLDKLLFSLQNHIEYLINNPNLPVDIRQMYLRECFKSLEERHTI